MLCLTHLFNLSIKLFITDHTFRQKAKHQTCLSWRYHRNFVRLYHEFLSEILWDKIEKKLNKSKLLRFGALQNVQISRNQFFNWNIAYWSYSRTSLASVTTTDSGVSTNYYLLFSETSPYPCLFIWDTMYVLIGQTYYSWYQ